MASAIIATPSLVVTTAPITDSDESRWSILERATGASHALEISDVYTVLGLDPG